MEKERNNHRPEDDGIDSGMSRSSGAVSGMIMVFEDDLRKAAGKRAIEPSEQHRWMECRRGLPISEWAERSEHRIGAQEIGRLRRELTQFLELFEAEAEERSLTLDMDRNYYSEALNRLIECRRLRRFTAVDRDCIRELMILVDWKDAVLGLQILKSVV